MNPDIKTFGCCKEPDCLFTIRKISNCKCGAICEHCRFGNDKNVNKK